MSQKTGLTRNKLKAIRALLATPTVAGAARRCGLAERSIWRYLADDGFKAALRERQDKAIGAASAALAGLTGAAIEALRDLLKDKDTSASVRARVALGVLEQRRKIGELDDLAERVRLLEEAQR